MTSNGSRTISVGAGLFRRFYWRFLLTVLMSGTSSLILHAAEPAHVKNVLVLLPGQSGVPSVTLFLGGFRGVLLSAPGLAIDISAEHVPPMGSSRKELERKLVEYIREKYPDHRFDIVVAWAGDALEFLVRNKKGLWPDAMALACVMGAEVDSAAQIPDCLVTVLDYDFPGTVAAIRRLHPDTKRIALVGGYAAEDLMELELARIACKEGFPGVEIIDCKGESPREIMEGLAALPEKTVVILSSMLADARGRPVVGADWLPLAVASSHSPLYTVFAHLVGKGVIGGSVIDFEKVGAEVGHRTLRILHGEPSGSSKVEHTSAHTMMFDWRELKRWGISEGQLPPGSKVSFRSTSFWEEYHWYIIGTVLLLATFTLSTAGLAIERKYRKRAQKDLAERLRLETERLQVEAMVANLSVPLVRASPEQLPGEIASGLRQIAGLLGFDRGTYFEIAPGTNELTAVAAGGSEGTPLFSQGEVLTLPWTVEQLRRSEYVQLDSTGHRFPESAREEQEFLKRTGLRSALLVPLEEVRGTLGVLSLGAFHDHATWPPDLISRLTIIGRVFSGAIAQKRLDSKLREALDEVTALKQKLEAENLYLREAAGARVHPEEIVGKSEGMKSVLLQVERVAPTDATVLILGETGTGKELIASAIHRMSNRKDRPMIKVNCAALPPTLIEAELFGREKGAYTGALTKQAGRFELAHRSTIFLDEIGELTPDLQVKLLRVLQDGELQRVGGTQTINVDTRVIAATNRDLTAAVREGKFREDLFYRLNVFPISVPPLRFRKDDIPLLTWTFVKELGDAFGKPVERIPQDTMESLQSYPWPGNVRELRNVVERALILSDSSTLHVSLSLPPATSEPVDETIEVAERRIILDALERTGWRVRGPGGAAEILHLKPSTLEYRMKRHGLKRAL